MRIRWGLAAELLLLSSTASAAPRHWRIYQADPDIKVSVCYPTDLLHIHHNKKDEGEIDLSGSGGAQVLVGGRPDKYTTLKDDLRYAIAINAGGPSWIHDPGPGLTPLRFYNIPRKKITSSLVTKDSYLFVMESRREVTIGWAVHVDNAIKTLDIDYPKSQASAWKGVPERMRSCFKSLGPITNPLVQ